MLPVEKNITWPMWISHFSPTAESFGVSAQIGSGVVRDGPEVRFHKGSTRVPQGARTAVGRALQRTPHAVRESPELIQSPCFGVSKRKPTGTPPNWRCPYFKTRPSHASLAQAAVE